MIEKILMVIGYHYSFVLALGYCVMVIVTNTNINPKYRWYLDYKYYICLFLMATFAINFKLAIINLLNAWG